MPLNDNVPEYWEEIARSDLETIRILERESGPRDVIVYHCHQCVEKLLKSVILRKGKKILRIHDLERLFVLAEIPGGDSLLDSIIILNTIAMNCRYPISEKIDERLGGKALKAFAELLSSLAPHLSRTSDE